MSNTPPSQANTWGHSWMGTGLLLKHNWGCADAAKGFPTLAHTALHCPYLSIVWAIPLIPSIDLICTIQHPHHYLDTKIFLRWLISTAQWSYILLYMLPSNICVSFNSKLPTLMICTWYLMPLCPYIQPKPTTLCRDACTLAAKNHHCLSHTLPTTPSQSDQTAITSWAVAYLAVQDDSDLVLNWKSRGVSKYSKATKALKI